MGTLKSFIRYLDQRRDVLEGVEKQLCQLQEKYESFFQEVERVREAELQQLTQHILADRSKLPEDFNARLDEALQEVEQELAAKLEKLAGKRDKLLREAEAVRKQSRAEEKKIRKKNVQLDRQEEELKAQNVALLAEIAEHNQRIRQLGRGFGFFANIFRMRRLARQQAVLNERQQNLAARIDKLRATWSKKESGYTEAEEKLQAAWLEKETEAAGLQTKIEHLEATRGRIVLRSTVERVLFKLAGKGHPAGQNDAPCPRCKAPNPEQNHFCHICARRLVEDEPDFAGSTLEIAELNQHHTRFSEGMQACQEIIGLVRGLSSGLTTFKRSVADVKQSQDKHNLSTLSIDVPDHSRSYGQHFDQLGARLKTDLSLHPTAFADQVKDLLDDVFTEPKIKSFFESMGKTLSREAKSQWD